ncbi:hypothetical protein RS130_16295 [Paraglaciecola aquimarina]|uniref:Uncharacterized protein n=1 Tax=Paraglaciecola aquimarina TaxID=1235557 RepID=A0ABU3SZ14_9ALTE|nr:hypothetical protein [Paraglaciecola aquimarina]MDU0355256.1 hypothetical protein [Paraglaciecola aquimarina]
MSEIIEFSLLDANLICITEQITPPSTKAELHQLIGQDKTEAGSVLFSKA